MSYLFICDDNVELGRDKEATLVMFFQTINCIKRLEAVYVKGEHRNISTLGLRHYTLCVYFIVEEEKIFKMLVFVLPYKSVA